MRYLKTCLLTGLLVLSNQAVADISGYLSLTSDYDYRGFSQTAEDLALQAGLDYSHDSGFYLSAWGSSLDWGKDLDANIEIDLIIGYGSEIGDSGLSWDAGYIAYLYPGLSAANFGEIYTGIGYGDFSLKLSWSADFAGVGASAWYLDAGYGHEWDSGWSFLVYAGYSFGDAFSYRGGLGFGVTDYLNYGVGAGYTMGRFYLEAKVVGTNLAGPMAIGSGVFANDLRAVFSATFSLP